MSSLSYKSIIVPALVATLGGFLFGYDTGVIAGSGTYFKEYFHLSPVNHGFVVSSALLGCMFGSIISGILNRSLGRKRTLILTGVLFLISAVGSAMPESTHELVIYRVLGGAGVGLASAVAPVYIAEISPAQIRGKLVSLNQLAIVTGFLVVFFVNYAIQSEDMQWNIEIGWRLMFASESIPAILFILLLFFIPRSPRYEVMKNREDSAFHILEKINGKTKAIAEIEAIKQSFHQNSYQNLRKYPNLMVILSVGIGLAIFQQITGINAILYYGNDIFKSMGAGEDAAMINQIVVGGSMLVFTVLAIILVERIGRKPLLLFGTLGMGIMIFTFGFFMFQGNFTSWNLTALVGYIAFFSFSQGPIVWVYLSEIFPNQIRGIAMSIAVFFQWLANYLVSQTFPIMADESGFLYQKYNGAFPFWLYGLFCFIAVLFIWRFVPETKSKSLEEMDDLWKTRSINKSSSA